MNGSFYTDGEFSVLTFERQLKHPIEKVWDAITRPEQLIGWLARPSGEFSVGAKFEMTWLNEPYVQPVEVIAVRAPELLEYRCGVHGVLRWELREVGDGTVLRLTARISTDTVGQLAGWHWHLDVLEGVLGGEFYEWDRWAVEGKARFGELLAFYS